MTEKMKRNKLNIVIIIALAAIGIMIAFAYSYGDDIRADEVFSVGFANNTRDFLFLTRTVCEDNSVGGWVPGEFIKEYFSVEKGEEFAFLSIYRNVRSDVHPPLYFMLLNVVSSFWTGQYTVIPGHLINILLSAVMMIFLYLVGCELFNKKWIAVSLAVMWITSIGAADSINYIRMYLALCVISVVVIYVSIQLMKEQCEKYVYIFMGVCVIVGTLIHYYFYIMCFFSIVYVTAYFIKNKEYNRLWKYILSLAIGEMVSVALYPYVIKHILFSDRGEQVQENLASTDLVYYIDHLKGFYDTYNTEVFNGYAIWCIGIVAVLFVFAIIGTRNKERVSIGKENYKRNIGLIATVTGGYMIVLFKISYSCKWIYVSLTFALIYILIVSALAYIVCNISEKYGLYLLVVLVAIFAIYGVRASVQESFEKKNAADIRNNMLNKQIDGKLVFFVYHDWSDTLDNQGSSLLHADYVRFISENELADIDWEGEIRKCSDNSEDIIFYQSLDVQDEEKHLTDCCESIGAISYNCIWKDNYIISVIQR